MSKMGYTVYVDRFQDHVMNLCTQYDTMPSSSCASISWAGRLLTNCHNFQLQFNESKKFKENLVFFHRSPLSLHVHREQEEYLHFHEALKKMFSVSVVYCWSDEIRQSERISERNYWAEGTLKSVLESLEDECKERLQKIEASYLKFSKVDTFDASLPTTSSKQATANLLTLCGIDFDPVFDVSKFVPVSSDRSIP
eukprot:TRINITY_DN5710_c0_g1_i6.p1 TRINITY_DN5710_c0_g1~~TRINITY_DN5710_c0_g1_i6.p1  ORF type:complete len:196 (+),score=22.85 TRINITY_DN5710_c0_g1_i6:435-1022(+)